MVIDQEYAHARRAQALAQHVARDHDALDIARALVDLRDARITEEPFDKVLALLE